MKGENDVCKAIQRLLELIWNAGYEYLGSWKGLFYDEDRKEWYVETPALSFTFPLIKLSFLAKYLDIYPRDNQNHQQFMLIRAVLHLGIPYK